MNQPLKFREDIGIIDNKNNLNLKLRKNSLKKSPHK